VSLKFGVEGFLTQNTARAEESLIATQQVEIEMAATNTKQTTEKFLIATLKRAFQLSPLAGY
jgi:hypothetical protein